MDELETLKYQQQVDTEQYEALKADDKLIQAWPIGRRMIDREKRIKELEQANAGTDGSTESNNETVPEGTNSEG